MANEVSLEALFPLKGGHVWFWPEMKRIDLLIIVKMCNINGHYHRTEPAESSQA